MDEALSCTLLNFFFFYNIHMQLLSYLFKTFSDTGCWEMRMIHRDVYTRAPSVLPDCLLITFFFDNFTALPCLIFPHKWIVTQNSRVCGVCSRSRRLLNAASDWLRFVKQLGFFFKLSPAVACPPYLPRSAGFWTAFCRSLMSVTTAAV